jgi:hypothetical protein
MQDLIGYDEIIENSMRLVIFEALKKVEKSGLQGKHHFVITFFTQFPGVSIPQSLLERYPEEMTVVIQYQYRALTVEQESFKISLSFNGRYETLAIPFKAISSFNDPSMNFALKFSMSYSEVEELEDEDFDEFQNNRENGEKSSAPKIDLSAKVISLDAFRQNKASPKTSNQ